MINNSKSRLILLLTTFVSFACGTKPKKPSSPDATKQVKNPTKKMTMDQILDSILTVLEHSGGTMILTYKMFRDDLTKIGEVSTKMKAIQDKYKELEASKKDQDPKAPLSPEDEAKAATFRQMINDINGLIMQLNGHLTEAINIFAQLLQDRYTARCKESNKEPKMIVRILTVGFGGMMGADTICSNIPSGAPQEFQNAHKRARKQIIRITSDQYKAAIANKAETGNTEQQVNG